MKFSKIIKKIESSNARLFKEAVILEQMLENNEVFFQGLNLAYNKLLTFGVKQIPISSNDGEGFTWDEFKEISNGLINRKITGHAARDEIINLMNKSEKDEWNFFYRRILLKDMRCGVSEKTINNVAKKNNFENFQIPVFACQLAQDVENHKKKLIGNKILEVKLDGVRAISILYPSGKVDIFSRNGKELLNFDHLKDTLRESINENKIKVPTVLDGEIVSDNFQNLMKQIHRKVTVQNSDACLYLFDILPFEKFKKGFYEVDYAQRSKDLIEWINKGYKVFGTSRDALTANMSNLTLLGIDKKVDLLTTSVNDFRSIIFTLEKTNPDFVSVHIPPASGPLLKRELAIFKPYS